MGQYFIVVNPAKKQYIDASRFNESIKSGGVLNGYHATAVAFLVSNINQVRDGWNNPIFKGVELAGSWFGDQVFVAGDECSRPDEFGIKTGSDANPERNLNQMAREEYEDISYKSIALICNAHEEFANELARRAARSHSADRELVNLGSVVLLVGCDALGQALANEFGNEWISRYKEAFAK